MHRQPEHVMTYLLAELGTNGNLDGQQRLVVKGRFAPKYFEGILRRYVSKFINLGLLIPSFPNIYTWLLVCKQLIIGTNVCIKNISSV